MAIRKIQSEELMFEKKTHITENRYEAKYSLLDSCNFAVHTLMTWKRANRGEVPVWWKASWSATNLVSGGLGNGNTPRVWQNQ